MQYYWEVLQFLCLVEINGISTIATCAMPFNEWHTLHMLLTSLSCIAKNFSRDSLKPGRVHKRETHTPHVTLTTFLLSWILCLSTYCRMGLRIIPPRAERAKRVSYEGTGSTGVQANSRGCEPLPCGPQDSS
jgi:hypothetical protein